jgi:hypothetical protein
MYARGTPVAEVNGAGKVYAIEKRVINSARQRL